MSAEKGQRLQPVSATPLDREFEAFIIDCQARSLSPRTIALYREKYAYWRNLFADMDVTDVASMKAIHVRQGMVTLEQTHNPGGVHVLYRVLKTFLRWLVAEDVIETNPIARVKPPKLSSEPLNPVPLHYVRAMMATCRRKTFRDLRDRSVLLCLLDTGCRASEFLALTLGDVNLTTGAVMVRQGKGGKFRTVFLGVKSRRELVRYLRRRHDPQPVDPLWTTDEGTPLKYQGLRKMVLRRAQLAGIPTPSLHSFRRAFALACLRNGVDLISLQRLMGHADLTVLHRYLAQVEGDLKAAHEKGGPVDNLL
jgi:integrase/recombinase XerD